MITKYTLRVFPFVLFLVVLLYVPRAFACDCSTPSVDEAFNDADVVFSGIVTAITVQDQEQNLFNEEHIDVSFRLIKNWKGDETEIVTLNTVHNKVSCNGYWFDEGKEYLVYAKRGSDGSLGTGICSRTDLLANAQSDLTVLEKKEESLPAMASREAETISLMQKIIELLRALLEELAGARHFTS